MSIDKNYNHFQYPCIARLSRNCKAHYEILQPCRKICRRKNCLFVHIWYIYIYIRICDIQYIHRLLLNPHSMFQVCIAAWDENKYHFYLFCCIACETIRKVAVSWKIYLIYNKKSLNNWATTLWKQWCILAPFSLQITFFLIMLMCVEYVLCQYCGCWWPGAMAPGHQQQQY